MQIINIMHKSEIIKSMKYISFITLSCLMTAHQCKADSSECGGLSKDTLKSYALCMRKKMEMERLPIDIEPSYSPLKRRLIKPYPPGVLSIDTQRRRQKLYPEEVLPTHVSQPQQLAVLVPFRNRFEQLQMFLPHIYNFLNRQHLAFRIFILQQVDKYRFNRGSLINVGFLFARKHYDYIAIHDVDILPVNDYMKYDYPATGSVHIAGSLWSSGRSGVGGVLLISSKDFERVNGMSNMYWGWGHDDDDFNMRLNGAGLVVRRPTDIIIENSFKDIHDEINHIRDRRRCFNQPVGKPSRHDDTGLNDVKYTIHKIAPLTFENVPFTLINVELHCNRDVTPWCMCEHNANNTEETYNPFIRGDLQRMLRAN